MFLLILYPPMNILPTYPLPSSVYNPVCPFLPPSFSFLLSSSLSLPLPLPSPLFPSLSSSLPFPFSSCPRFPLPISPLSFVPERGNKLTLIFIVVATAKQHAGNLPLYYSEYNDVLYYPSFHDTSYAAAFIAKNVHDVQVLLPLPPP